MNERKTIFSPCRRYRYTLWREWGVGALPIFESHQRPEAYVQFIGLNPSTADETQDDPTVRRCIDFAKRWGFGALCMTNAFAWRDTEPEKMKAQRAPTAEPCGFESALHRNRNDYWLAEIAKGAGLVIAAWGQDGNHLGRQEEIIELFEIAPGLSLHCLGINKDGTPKHPLYLRSDTQPQLYHGRVKADTLSGTAMHPAITASPSRQ